MKRTHSKKSYSWWWDSHISPKNSKWLEENLEEMDQSVKRMLKLIEEDGDSFAKKAEMYYQKRPELVSHVEEFYRMYRSLAERYDQLTGELRKSLPSDLQSQGSGVSDTCSESASAVTVHKKPSRRKSGPRAAGFEFFLGSAGGSPDRSQKESDESSSSSSSESESDGASSKNNFLGLQVNGDGEGLHERLTELEVELSEVKEKLRLAEETKVSGNGNYEELLGRITWYEEELKVANERLQLSEEEAARLKFELKEVLQLQEENARLKTNVSVQVDKIEALEQELTITNKKLEASEEEISRLKLELEHISFEAKHGFPVQVVSPRTNSENGEIAIESENSCSSSLEADVKDREHRVEALEEELNNITNKLQVSEEEIARLRSELEKSEPDSKVQAMETELIVTCRRLEASEEEIRALKLELERNNSHLSGVEADVIDREHKIGALEEELKTRESKLQSLEGEIERLMLELKRNEILAATIATLQVQLDSAQKDIETKEAEAETEKRQILDLQEQIMKLEANVMDRDNEIVGLKVSISEAENNFSLEKFQLQEAVSGLTESCAQLEANIKELELKVRSLEEEIKHAETEKNEIQLLQVASEMGLKNEIEQLKTDIIEKSSCIEELNKTLDAVKLKYDTLMAERDELNAKVLALNAEVSSRDDQINQKDQHLQQLHMEHVELISGSEAARKLAQDLDSRVKELEEEVERQKVMISEGAEEKREVIRQLCFSLEHYRDGYKQLRQAFLSHRPPTVMAS